MAHFVAGDLDEARQQWVATFGRDSADLGPAAASRAAARAAAGYTQPTQPAEPARLADILQGVRAAWTEQAAAHRQLERLQERLENARSQAAWEAHCHQILGPLQADRDTARAAAQRAEQAAAGCAAVLAEGAQQHAARLRQAWDAQLGGADAAARTLASGAGRLGIHRARVRDAAQHLQEWAAAWAPVLAHIEIERERVRQRPISYPSNTPLIADALYQHAQHLAAAEHPEHATRLRTAEHAREHYGAAAATHHQARRELERLAHGPVYDTGAGDLIPDLSDNVDTAHHRIASADRRVATLSCDPALTSRPDSDTLLEVTRAAWHADRVAEYQQQAFAASSPLRSLSREPNPTPEIDHGPSIGR